MIFEVGVGGRYAHRDIDKAKQGAGRSPLKQYCRVGRSVLYHIRRIGVFQMLLTSLALLLFSASARDSVAQSTSSQETRFVRAAEQAGFKVLSFKSQEPAAIHSRYPFASFEFDEPYLAELREQYHLRALVEDADNEWTAQLILKDWVYRRIPGGNPISSPGNALEILEKASMGEKFYCTYYAITYVECAHALGWQARKIGVDRKHAGGYLMGSSHHGVAEVWSNQFCKWVVIDPQSNLHFEKNGVPLGAYEIRAEWLRDQGQQVDHVVGAPPHTFDKNPAMVWSVPDEDEIATYYWLYVQDSAVKNSSDSKFLLLEDEYNSREIWFQNNAESGHSQFHSAYVRNRFIPTERMGDLYWTVGIVELEVAEVRREKIYLRLSSYCPNFRRYEMTRDGAVWTGIGPEFIWELSVGWNTLGFRTVNSAEVTGPETAFVILLEAQE